MTTVTMNRSIAKTIYFTLSEPQRQLMYYCGGLMWWVGILMGSGVVGLCWWIWG